MTAQSEAWPLQIWPPKTWPPKTWLVVNAASGSNDEETLAALEDAFAQAQWPIARKVIFPEENAPAPADLHGAGVDLVVIFTGDGSMNAVVTSLAGWDGAVLVLPGGTMNLLAGRLHGEVEAAEIIARVARGEARRVRPPLVRSNRGDGLTGVLAGPGTSWNNVREAMRESDVLGILGAAADAIGESAVGSMVTCRDAKAAREEGYSLIMVTPTDAGLELAGYYAESIGDYAKQGVALLRRNFRDGPHDELGAYPSVTLASTDGAAMGLLIDGEPFDGAAEEVLTVARGEVDLLATNGD